MLQPSVTSAAGAPGSIPHRPPAAANRNADVPQLQHIGNSPVEQPLNRASVGGGSSLAPYAMGPGQARDLQALLRGSRRVLHPDYALPPHHEHRSTLETFLAKRDALLNDAQRAEGRVPVSFQMHAGPPVNDCRAAAELLQRLLADNRGLVVAAPPAGAAAKQLLFDNLALLRRLGVDTLYIDHLPSDIHQTDLDQLYHSGQMTTELDRALSLIDYDPVATPAHTNGDTVRALLMAAARAGMRLVAIDLAASHHCRGVDGRNNDPRQGTPDARRGMFNHVATRRIQEHQRALPAATVQRRWVALVDAACAGDHAGKAGLAGQLGVPSLLVHGVPLGDPAAFRAGHDPGGPIPQDLRCDYLAKVPQRGGRRPLETPEPCSADQVQSALRLRVAIEACAARLARVGMYQLATDGSGGQVVVHRSGNGTLVAQPIVPGDEGGLRLQLADTSHPQRWSHLHGEFADLNALYAALDTLLERAGDPPPSPIQD